MADPSAFDFLRIPVDVLIALDNRTFHFAVQPWHYLIRIVHIVSMAGFFGGIVFLDLRLMGLRSKIAICSLSEHILPWIYGLFGITVLTGIPLFLYDPVHVGSHAYFAPKLVLLTFGLLNAVVFHKTTSLRSLTAEGATPWSARIAGFVSILLWSSVIVFSSLNVEGVPKVLLR
jgi:hypothetical protein